MLRIEPAIQIHTSRTGAWRFSATFRDAIRQRMEMPITKTVHFRHFLRCYPTSPCRRAEKLTRCATGLPESFDKALPNQSAHYWATYPARIALSPVSMRGGIIGGIP